MGRLPWPAAHLTNSTTKQMTPTPRPTLPMAVASTLSASCSGVGAASVATSAMVRPHSLSLPTASTSRRPLPSVTCPQAPSMHAYGPSTMKPYTASMALPGLLRCA